MSGKRKADTLEAVEEGTEGGGAGAEVGTAGVTGVADTGVAPTARPSPGSGSDSSDGSSDTDSSSDSDSDSDEREGYAAPTAGEVHLRVSTLNPFLICALCNGYFRDAMSSVECLHTFCKQCILMYIRDGGNKCPQCALHLGAKPRSKFLMDATLQGLVNKLLPDHVAADAVAKDVFERAQGGAGAKPAEEEDDGGGDDPSNKQRAAYEVVLRLLPTPDLPVDQTLPPLPKPVLRTSSALTLTHLKQYLAVKFADCAVSPEEVVLRCRGLVLTGKEHSLVFVMKTKWMTPGEDLLITYSRTDPVAAAAETAAAQ